MPRGLFQPKKGSQMLKEILHEAQRNLKCTNIVGIKFHARWSGTDRNAIKLATSQLLV